MKHLFTKDVCVCKRIDQTTQHKSVHLRQMDWYQLREDVGRYSFNLGERMWWV